MKKITTILLIVFVLQHTLPFLQTIWGEEIMLVADIVDEKKIVKEDTKLKKDYLHFTGNLNLALNNRVNTQIHRADNIKAHPCFDERTPPPDLY